MFWVFPSVIAWYPQYPLPWDSPVTWVLAALGIDFCYYWVHRAHHGRLLVLGIKFSYWHGMWLFDGRERFKEISLYTYWMFHLSSLSVYVVLCILTLKAYLMGPLSRNSNNKLILWNNFLLHTIYLSTFFRNQCALGCSPGVFDTSLSLKTP